jgi:hypothetical protein
MMVGPTYYVSVAWQKNDFTKSIQWSTSIQVPKIDCNFSDYPVPFAAQLGSECLGPFNPVLLTAL